MLKLDVLVTDDFSQLIYLCFLLLKKTKERRTKKTKEQKRLKKVSTKQLRIKLCYICIINIKLDSYLFEMTKAFKTEN